MVGGHWWLGFVGSGLGFFQAMPTLQTSENAIDRSRSVTMTIIVICLSLVGIQSQNYCGVKDNNFSCLGA
ncbi:MAG: hypothetical protein F6K65_03560 [Moorea sp. SIO3C2]|nr:hypothetical protein [Moorena sp. SIO3C2]